MKNEQTKKSKLNLHGSGFKNVNATQKKVINCENQKKNKYVVNKRKSLKEKFHQRSLYKL